MLLSELVRGLEIKSLKGNPDIAIEAVAYDSRKARQGSLFVCIDGTVSDGHKYIADAIENGTRAFLVQRPVEVPEGITVVEIEDTRYGLACVADAFFGHPSQKFNLVGITGTKGKTTTSYMVRAILQAASHKTGLIGTVANLIGDEILYATRTTPESYDLQSLFSDMAEKKVDSTVIEVSSQGLELHRVAKCDFDIGVFTNFSRDHIGPKEHATLEEYFNAKAKLFGMCKQAVINIDSEHGRKMAELAKCKVYTYGISENADIRAINIIKETLYTSFMLVSPWGGIPVKTNLQGNFNIYNALAAIGACCLIPGITLEHVKEGLMNVNVPGRMETVPTYGNYSVLIDYAHTPDSLEKVLSTVKEFARGRVVSLFGCGGDRDAGKRPQMGEISGDIADFSIITSDNPRTEDPEKIINDIEAGMLKTDGKYIKITDRRQAIKFALENTQDGDIIVLAGKGHETYQQFKDKTIHFDEREVVNELLAELGRSAE
ncbi:UDP-N-acetylmuramoylalanyl-D-glutamate--2,6-diaminopimelate ligase [Ruminiclostridium sufflavum DSM 19573]|uniref:UDP-N-acetylmuramoyl-L-alanyl-D-glutamate--2,6-diaminopimelate ligase n=1 Tax=Ruminiclostridium sufflavum DSM 19573 TaxID=1121337 RepID=A0A318XNM4_9FIRM|nr:UDP-N-acetylmuramoyl-L-alanyl-D-glutamate--2,6-diaminopimelate ligase [Ruminiclostridium sufflavum]PYG88436.1 UDP-N-acetylmuramoylalanyl-D-glutamate--2,6-diaminopimelate ligase [Ruminiclostridium sufflavum DSM 19573]